MPSTCFVLDFEESLRCSRCRTLIGRGETVYLDVIVKVLDGKARNIVEKLCVSCIPGDFVVISVGRETA